MVRKSSAGLLSRTIHLLANPVRFQFHGKFPDPLLHHLQAFGLQSDQLVLGFQQIPWLDLDFGRLGFDARVEEHLSLPSNPPIQVYGRVPGHKFLEELEASLGLARPSRLDERW